MLPHHLKECKYISAELRAEAARVMGDSSLGARVAQEDKKASALPVASAVGSGLKQTSLKDLAQEGGANALQLRFDHAVLQFFAASQSAAEHLDLKQFKKMISVANPRLKTFSSTTLLVSHMPTEAAHVRSLSIARLRTLDNLTLSFDGGTTRSVQSVWTFHVTEPDTRESHLLHGDSSSGLSHTAEYIAGEAKQVIDEIGADRFALLVSDGAGAPELARELLVEQLKTVLSMTDPPHYLNNLLKALGSLDYFSAVRCKIDLTRCTERNSRQSRVAAGS